MKPKSISPYKGYDLIYGARPLRRLIQKELETKLGRAMLSEQVMDGSHITISMDNSEIKVSFVNTVNAVEKVKALN